ncbi:uncharacterized protein LOC135581575 isoform X3 [Musa acuminata AAA Group]|uniref:uncharacterized protein LOC135581575 isoform X3 n=1 Tax=Musa acuminata AAA Group TaxID=214697 RepID=UPI0031DB427C
MRSALLRRLSRAVLASSSPSISFTSSCYCRSYAVSAPLVEDEAQNQSLRGLGVSYGLNWALAARGVIIKDKSFHNLQKSELQKKEHLATVPLYVRGCTSGGGPEISNAQFGKILKQVTSHISSVSDVFVQDGVIGSSPKCDVKVRVISDNPSAMLSLSNILWETPSRAISHDSCPLTVYIASSISSSAMDFLRIGSQASNGFAAADVERSSLIICGKAFADATAVKNALAALAAPVIFAREGLPLSARLLVSGDSVILLFAPEDTIKKCAELFKSLVSVDTGVILSSHGTAPFFQTKDSAASNLLKKPSSVIFATADSTGVFPLISKLSPGQAAYHFLAGYQEGKFVPAYIQGPSPIDLLELAKALFLELIENEIPSFLINVSDSGEHITGKEYMELVESTFSGKLSDSKPNASDAKGNHISTSFLPINATNLDSINGQCQHIA